MSRMSWSSVTLLVTVMALAGCGDSPSAPGRTVTQPVVAAEAEVSGGRAQASFSGLAPTCDGESVNMTTVIDYQWHTTTLASGDRMLTQHTRFSTDGVGTTSGARYIGRGTANTSQVFRPLPIGCHIPDCEPLTYTSVFRIQNVVQGSADNDVVMVHAKWTINSNGQVSVALFNVNYDCRG